LEKIRPHMRRNRRGPGGSGSLNVLARALRVKEGDLKAAFVTLGLAMPAAATDQPVYLEVGAEQWWLNLDSRGGLWINGREKREGEPAPSGEAPAAPAVTESPASAGGEAVPAPVAAVPPPVENAAPAAEPAPASPFSAVRPLLKETRAGAFSGEVCVLAEQLGRNVEQFVGTLVAAGLKVPEKPREKPVRVEHAGESIWFSRNAKGELWLNAKAAKSAGGEEEADGEESEERSDEGEASETRKPRRSRSRSSKKAS
jgi:hypothetical protein